MKDYVDEMRLYLFPSLTYFTTIIRGAFDTDGGSTNSA